jgi:hypothetical protein
MSSGIPVNSARATFTFASTELSDVDGVKTSAATIASETTYLPAVMDGAGIDTSGQLLKCARTVTVTLAAGTGAYNDEDPIVVSGTYGGEVVTQEFTPSDADGSEILYGDQPFDTLTSIVIPAQDDTDGAFSFGVGDICARKGDHFTAVRCDTQITLHVQYGEGASNKSTDAHAVAQYDVDPVAPSRVLTGDSETAGAAVTVYIS